MCCSPECGQVYFERIEKARNPAPKTKGRKSHIKREAIANEPSVVSEATLENTKTEQLFKIPAEK